MKSRTFSSFHNGPIQRRRNRGRRLIVCCEAESDIRVDLKINIISHDIFSQLLNISIPCSVFSGLHTLRSHACIPWDQLDFEVPWNRYQSRLDLIIVDIVRVRRLSFAGHDLETANQSNQSSVEESAGDELSRTRS